MSNKEERKGSPRLIVDLTAVLSTGEAHYFLEVENVSETGLRLRAKEVFPVGTQVHMVFGRPPELTRVTADGIVRWSESEKGVGVEFTSISPEDHQALLRFMNSQSRPEQA